MPPCAVLADTLRGTKLMGDDDATSQTLTRFERAFERISAYGMD